MGLSRRQFTKEFKLAAVRRLEQGVPGRGGARVGKRCACDRSSQVILGIAVSTRKMWTGEPEDGLDLNRGSSKREQGQQLSQSPYLSASAGT